MKVKPQLQWKLKDFEDARNMECLLRKTTVPRREAMWAANGKPIGMALHKTIGTEVMTPNALILDMDRIALVQSFLALLFLTFEKRMFILCYSMVEISDTFFILQGFI
jgi:hypothetical protein